LNIIIVGAGTVGYSLADVLSHQNHHISIIEKSLEMCNAINGKLDVFTVNSEGSNPAALESAGIKNADMVIAVTPQDETNLVVCNFALQYGVSHRFARVKSNRYELENSNISLETLGVTDVIEAEKEVVKNILRFVELPGVTEATNFHLENVYLRGYKITDDMPIANKTLVETNELTKPAHILIVLIVRNGITIIPRGSEKILPGDEIIAIMPKNSLDSFRALINRPASKIKKVVVYGDSLIAIQLCEKLKTIADRVILVDPDETHGTHAASVLKGVEVLFGDCTSVEMLQEVHVDESRFFIAVSNDYEDNIMSGLLAKAEGTPEVIAVSGARKHSSLFLSLGLDHVINPNEITAQTIIGNIIKVPIGSVLKLKNVDVEITRFTAGKNSKICNLAIKKFASYIKRSVIIGSILRDDSLIIPSGETVILENDEVIILSRPEDTEQVGKLFKSRLSLSSGR